MVSDSGHTSVERAVVAILRPLIKLALRLELAHGRFSDLAKEAYVDVARDHFTEPGRRVSASHIAVLTGLTRREVSRLLKRKHSTRQVSPRTRFNRAARVLGAWCDDAKYLDGRGAAASLPFDSEEGPSFTSLVRDHGADVTPRPVLQELVRGGSIRQLKDGRYRPVQRSYVPQLDLEAKLAILGADVADLISTIDHNLEAESGTPFFQRKVSYDNLPAAYLSKLHEIVQTEAQRLLERLNRDMAKHDRDISPSNSRGLSLPERHRAMIGIYFFEEAQDEEE
jgi:hypothetical protein